MTDIAELIDIMQKQMQMLKQQMEMQKDQMKMQKEQMERQKEQMDKQEERYLKQEERHRQQIEALINRLGTGNPAPAATAASVPSFASFDPGKSSHQFPQGTCPWCGKTDHSAIVILNSIPGDDEPVIQQSAGREVLWN